MGIAMSRCHAKHRDATAQLRARVRALEGEMRTLSLVREREARERRKYKEEAARLRRKAEEDEERIERLEGELVLSRENECEDWRQQWLGTECCLVEHLKEEQAQREVAVERWKRLYLTIKNELDELILRTRQGGRFGVGVEEGLIKQLQAELIAKEEAVEALRLRISLMEKEGLRREREIDILRQSLRILNNSKRKNGMRRKLQRRWPL